MLLGALFTNQPADPIDFIPSLIINFSGLLALLCLLFLTGFILCYLVPTIYPRSEVLKNLRDKYTDIFSEKLYFLIWLVPVSAMVLSLMMSEYLGFVPCRLCWYQRIFMYSLALLMLLYFFKRKKWMRITGYALCGIGGSISTYHAFIEMNPQFESSSCDPSVPCASPWFYAFGVLTLASMALLAFLTTAAMLFMSSRGEIVQKSEIKGDN